MAVQQFLVLERIVYLRIRHGAGVEPYVNQIRFALHGFAGFGNKDNIIYIRTVKVYLVVVFLRVHARLETFVLIRIGCHQSGGYGFLYLVVKFLYGFDKIAKLTIKLINSVADVINNDESINGKIKVVFIENYRVSNAEIIFAAADVSEQISTASKEASGTGNMKFMLNGALTLGTMDGANVEIVDEVGEENAFIFGLSSDEVINYENNGGYNPMDIFNSDMDIRKVLMQLINGFYSPDDPERFRPIYNSLLNTQETDVADRYFILKDFKSYAAAQKRVEEAYRNQEGWAKSAMLNVANVGKFTSDRTIEEYVQDIWHLEKVKVKMDV